MGRFIAIGESIVNTNHIVLVRMVKTGRASDWHTDVYLDNGIVVKAGISEGNYIISMLQNIDSGNMGNVQVVNKNIDVEEEKQENSQKSEKKDKEVLSVPEAGKMLGVSTPTMYKLLRIQGFPVIHVGRKYIIPRAGLLKWMAENSTDNLRIDLNNV